MPPLSAAVAPWVLDDVSRPPLSAEPDQRARQMHKRQIVPSGLLVAGGDPPVSEFRTSPVAPNQWRDLLPLRVGELVPMHASKSLARNADANFLTQRPGDEDGDEDEDEDGAPGSIRDTP